MASSDHAESTGAPPPEVGTGSVQRSLSDLPDRSVGGHSLASTIAVGFGIGTVLCVLNVLVLFRTGTSFGGSALVALLGAWLLRLLGRLTWQHLFIVFSLATSGYVATAALDTGIGTVMLQTGRTPAWVLLVVLAATANVIGVLLGMAIARGFVFTERLPFPTLRPAITLMQALTRSGGAEARSLGRVLPVAAAAAGAVAVVTDVTGHDTTPGVPGASFLSLALSPLLFGLGFLIGPRACLWLAAGSAYSMVVWFVRERADSSPISYDRHLTYPWVLACGVGLILGYSVMSLVRVRAPLAAALTKGVRPVLASPSGRRRAMASAVALLAAVAALAAVWGAVVFETVGFVLLGMVLVLVFGLFLNRAGGEIGIAPLAPVLYLSVALLAALGLGPTTAVLAAATICSTAIASVYYTYAVKVADTAPDGETVPARRIVWTQALGGVVGALLGISVIYVLIHLGLIGGHSFPAPIAQALGFIDSTVRDSADYSGAMGLALAVGGPVGAVLSFFGKVMPTMIGLGVLLPPAYSLTIGLGGLTRQLAIRGHAERQSTVEAVASGLIIGEGVVMVAVLTVRAFLE
ncbi:OPT/YSL family transporter [Streptomyces milbemycinicus]|uniref:OPT/YSL family transporter n=1 Tax=Streptomyces milbemycinicus TaxID=476552 RepID=UPI0033D12B14